MAKIVLKFILYLFTTCYLFASTSAYFSTQNSKEIMKIDAPHISEHRFATNFTFPTVEERVEYYMGSV
jgi:hypothetical protein